uniref:Elongation factor 1-alpha n=1 Tax=Paramoeba aestuarina TaxID=180227 RepID=A0A7S4KU83_9EUKA|mmetsp:Transcript_25668/g.40005  ORF Transcript_25668/g.40005 Transcript_25668/m.40005 type:complete len:452 (+) Transcript_25668:62-1417(+)|eukprot:CAMPEP_0201526808 /NCGR_PEP_ID=MMETSP0161_2-20130828/33042_1 /ASSEMBLY_ACC=CAM_ASM_000251 /TAXON_ID=180227 /ORGANISM="Neoparamoeba aestuarina, Strain SoJaBio B1-5/56/2" /LENGTH=451 /DNA_ID=CAMNT_0047927349 /DNA_START=57 /DNA_END=1412 /DNA_ORIENTATION=-
MADSKPHLNVVFIGHVDCGKSTTAGHLMYKLGGVAQRQFDFYGTESRMFGKESFRHAWVFDSLKAERERGITIDIKHKQFYTPKYNVTVIDTPGHRDFIKNMITGTSQSDAAILVVSAPLGEFEAGFSRDGQTREHALLAYALGIKQLICIINKMDAKHPGYEQRRFEEIKQEVSQQLKKVGYNTTKVQFIPTSGWLGENLVDKSARMPWYTGPTLLEAIDQLEVPKNTYGDKAFRMPIQDVYKISGIGTVAVGRVVTGSIKPAQTVSFAPHGGTGQIFSIERHHHAIEKASVGDYVGINVKRMLPNEIHRGDVASQADDRPALECDEFTSQIIVLRHPSLIYPGYTPVISCHTAHVACKFVEITDMLDRRTGKVLQTQPRSIKQGDGAYVRMKPIKPFCVETFKEYGPLGRFAVRDNRNTVAVGVVKEVHRKEYGKLTKSAVKSVARSSS